MVVELKEISFKSQAIEELFQELEKIKKLKQVPFKGGLPHVPLVVGLAGKIPNGINNLIAKFIGVKPHPAAQALVKKFWHWFGRYSRVAVRREFNARSYLPNPFEKVPQGFWVPGFFKVEWCWQWEEFCKTYLLERCRWKRPKSIRKCFYGYFGERIRRAKKSEKEFLRLRFARLPEKYQRDLLDTEAGKKLFNI